MNITSKNLEQYWLIKLQTGTKFLVERINLNEQGIVREIILRRVLSEDKRFGIKDPMRYKFDERLRKWRSTTFNSYTFSFIAEIDVVFCSSCGNEISPIMYCKCGGIE